MTPLPLGGEDELAENRTNVVGISDQFCSYNQFCALLGLNLPLSLERTTMYWAPETFSGVRESVNCRRLRSDRRQAWESCPLLRPLFEVRAGAHRARSGRPGRSALQLQ